MLAIMVSMALVTTVQAAPDAGGVPQFADGFMIGINQADLDRYAQGTPVEAGMHRVDVLVNGETLGRMDVQFEASDKSHIATPRLTASLVRQLPLKGEIAAALPADDDATVDLPGRVEGASVQYDDSTLQLLITLPQAALARNPRGYVAPELRDQGISALFADYNFNSFRTDGKASTFLGLDLGANLGAWRLRHRVSMTHGGQGTSTHVLGSYLQRDVPSMNAQLFLGEGNTDGNLFDSFAFMGMRIASDDRMLPDSLRGYAPVVRGMAQSNAKVTIRQNGQVIHEVSVAPGPFEIDDLFPTNHGGDLEVTITEADGSEQSFSTSFAAVPQALREGASRFSVAGGRVNSIGEDLAHIPFIEATYVRGINNRLTFLGGMQVADGYRSVLLGAAINTPIGAFGADITQAGVHRGPYASTTGHSIRANFQRSIPATGTNFGLAAYRYSTRGYMTLGEVAAITDDWDHDAGASRARQRFQVNLSQRLGERSQLHLSGGHVAYWDHARRQNDLQLGFHSTFRGANYSLSATRLRLPGGEQDTQYAFSVRVPLGSSRRAPSLSGQISQSAQDVRRGIGINGYLDEDRRINYSLSSSHSDFGGTNLQAYAGYQGGFGRLGAGYSRGQGRASTSFNAGGSVVLHGGGINLGQSLGQGTVLVEAVGAQGAMVGSSRDIRVARNGYALLPNISPYRWNQIQLDPGDLDMDVELLQTSRRVAPTAGGISRVAFDVRRERTLFIDATDALGQPPPFAAALHDEEGRSLGAVGQGGVIQLRGAQDAGTFIVDAHGPAACRIEYRMPEAPDDYGLYWSQATCTPQ